MTTKLKIVLLPLLLFSLISCDPIHNLNFINSTDSNTKVKLIIKPEMIKPELENYELGEISTGDSIVFNLKPTEDGSIYFGIGTWSDEDIDELVSGIKSLEIETNDIKTIYKSNKSIIALLKNNQKGFPWKTSINIEIK